MSIAQQLYHLQEVDIEIEADRRSLQARKEKLGESSEIIQARTEIAAEKAHM